MTSVPKRQPIPFGNYVLLDRINIGGMAEVWRAKTFGAGGFERLVAIKRILPNIAEDAEFIAMFIDEAKITVQLNHANIAQIYELASLGKSYFIAMEYVSGRDMRAIFDRCRKRGEPPPIPLSCYLIAQCCEGLDYAHRANDKTGQPMGIVHRDVSPQNALVSYDGEVKIIDFGIAKAAGKASKTQAGILKGKFGYMSPEQIRGLPLDRRSDVFAIGVCLYEMLTGERLFVGESDFSVLEKVRRVEVLPPSHFNRRVPDVLEKIVMKSLAKDIDERYSYASELGEDLRKFLYTSDFSFTRKDLAAFMKATFAEEYEKENQRLQEYADIKAEMVSQLPPPVPSVPPAAAATPLVNPFGSAPTGLSRPPRTAPPPLPPLLTPPADPPPAVRLGSMRLTAQPPAPTIGKEDEATILAAGGEDAGTGTDSRPSPEKPSKRTSGALPVEASVPSQPQPSEPQVRRRPSGALPAEASPASASQPPEPSVEQQPRKRTSGGLPVETPLASVSPVPVQADSPRRSSKPLPPRMAPPKVVDGSNSTSDSSLPEITGPGAKSPKRAERERQSSRVVMAIVGVGLALIGTIIALAIAFRPPPHGLLLIEVPAGAENVRVSINGKELVEPDGRPVRDYPQVREVRSGRVTVMMKAKGFETLTEVVEVKEGNEYTQLKQSMKKQE